MLYPFSSYTKGRASILAINLKDANYLLTLSLPKMFIRENGTKISFKQKFLKKKNRFFPESALNLGIDGVTAQVVKQSLKKNQFMVTVKIPADLYERSILKKMQLNSKVSISLPSINQEKKYLIENKPITTAKLIKEVKLADGHQYTQELNFETSLAALPALKNKWLGLNGSGFYIQQQQQTSQQIIEFKIHIGRLTRTRSVFGSTDMIVGQEFNLSSAFVDDVPQLPPPTPALLFSKKYKNKVSFDKVETPSKDERVSIAVIGKYELRGKSRKR